MSFAISSSIAVMALAAVVGVVAAVALLGAVVGLLLRRRRTSPLTKFAPSDTLSDTEAACQLPDGLSKSHTIQVRSLKSKSPTPSVSSGRSTFGSAIALFGPRDKGANESSERTDRDALALDLTGSGEQNGYGSIRGKRNGNTGSSKEMSPIQADPPFPPRTWLPNGVPLAKSPETESRVFEETSNATLSNGTGSGTSTSNGKSSPQPSLGMLEFSVAYESERDMLHVTILGASELPPMDPMLGTSDPYVKLQLLPEKKHRVKTRVIRHTLNPRFEETFTFYSVRAGGAGESASGSLETLALHMVVLSFDRFSRDQIVGEVLCPLAGLDLRDKELALRMRILPRHLKLRTPERGELLVSLSWQPAANRITAVVLKARNLPQMDLTGLAGDPYVKIYLLWNGQRIAKKKTHVKKRTLNPIYNESFVFELPASASPDLKAVEANVSLEFQVLDWDRVTKNEIIGRIVIGAGSASVATTGGSPSSSTQVNGAATGETGLQHWTQVLANPRKQIAEWHRLRE